MAMLDWLQKRLTPVKAGDERWTQLAAALEVLWREKFDPKLSDLESLRSVYTASSDDLQRKLREYGDYFAVDMPRLEDRPVGVAWRKLELEYKDIEAILYSVFRRHYSDLSVGWLPLYAAKYLPYGSLIIPGDSIEKQFLPTSDFYMTSRGLLETDLGHIFELGLTKAKFLETALPLVRRVKPLHIVFDGVAFYIKVPIDWTGGTKVFDLQAGEEDHHFPITFRFLEDRFDYLDADVKPLDTGHVKTWWEIDQPYTCPFTEGRRLPWRLDLFQKEGHPEGWIPLDMTRPGIEGEEIPDLALLFTEKSLDVALIDGLPWLADERLPAGIGRQSRRYVVGFDPLSDQTFATEAVLDVPYGVRRMHLDMYPLFDEVAADFAPLDMPIGERGNG